jgi:hypothetical protein
LQKRHEEAVIAEHAEHGKVREQFRILDPALPPSSHAAPDRLRLFVAGLFFATCFGVGLAFAVDRFDTSFHNIAELRAFTQLPVLVSIPRIVTERDTWKKAAMSCGMGIAGAAVVVCVGAGAFYFAQHSDWVTRMVLSRG